MTAASSPTTTFTGRRILVTGVTGQVGYPVARALAAAGHSVVGAARFANPKAAARLTEAGVECVSADLEAGRLDDVPADVDHVVHLAVAKTNDFDRDLAANGEGLGLLLDHCRVAQSALVCSSTAVYQPDGHHPFVETDPLGDNHRPFGFMPTYSISKIAAEVVARLAARQHGLPTTIARLSVPYGDRFGWPLFHLAMMAERQPVPVHANEPSVYHPIHVDDLVRTLPALLAAASVPATIVNWAGDDPVSIEEWCGWLGELTGLEPRFEHTTDTIESVVCDLTRMHELIGRCTVGWRDGLRRMVAASRPDLLRPAPPERALTAPGALVLVGTPIGNLGDLAPRAVEALAGADLICCEDTRRTGRLLQHAGVSGHKLLTVNDHTEAGAVAEVLRRLTSGQRVAVVTDAGMPGISDPGERLVRAAAADGHVVEVVPGPSAAVTALVASGLPAGRFSFEGFLPRKGSGRAERLSEVAGERRTVVLYEAPHRLARTLADLRAVCGADRRVVLARELTKLHEELWRGTLAEAVDQVAAVEPRGEYVVVLHGAPPPGDATDDDVVAALDDARAAGASTRDAVAAVAARLRVGRRRVYDLATGRR